MVRKKYDKKELALAISFALISILIITLYLWHQAEIVRIGYESGELEKKVLFLNEEVKKLETKKSALLALERVEKIAKEELSLIEPTQEQVIYDEGNLFPY